MIGLPLIRDVLDYTVHDFLLLPVKDLPRSVTGARVRPEVMSLLFTRAQRSHRGRQ